MFLDSYPRKKIGLLIKAIRLQQNLDRKQLSEQVKINQFRLFQIENGQSILDEEIIFNLFDELLIEKDNFGIYDDYINSIFDNYLDNYFFGLKKNNCEIIEKATHKEINFENSIYFYRWLLIKYFHGVVQKETNKEFIELRLVLNKLENDLEGIELQSYYLCSALEVTRKGGYKESICILNKALAINNEKILGMVYYHLFINYSHINNNDTASMYLYNALEIFKKSNNFIRITECILHQGVLATHIKSYDIAENYFNEAIKLGKMLNLDNIVWRSYHNLSWLKILQKEYTKSYEFTKKSLQIKKDPNLYFNAAYILYKQNKNSESLDMMINSGKALTKRNSVLSEEFRFIEFARNHTQTEAIEFLYKTLDRIKNKANRDDYLLLLSELLDLLNNQNRLNEIIIVQKQLMSL